MLDNKPPDILYTTLYPYWAAQYYGPSTLIMEPDTEMRGIDLGYYIAVQSKRLANRGRGLMRSCHDVPNGRILEPKIHLPDGEYLEPDVPDAGKILFPGYIRHQAAVGF